MDDLILVGVTGLYAFVKTCKTTYVKRVNFPGGKLYFIKLEEKMLNKHDSLRKMSMLKEVKKKVSDLIHNNFKL